MGVLGEKTVSGMDGIDIGNLGSTDDAVDFQIAFTAGCRTDTDRLIGELHMEGVDIRFGIDGHGANAEFLAGTNNPQGNLPPIGDKDFLEHEFGDPVALADPEENLTEFNRLSIFRHNFHDLAGNLSLDLVHDLHRFDDTDNALGADRFSDFNE